ncbi:MAG: phosphatidylserine decarboxylase family protein [Bacteroidales bacterium]|nr:phosphatidylserine decarboxylase family protein [Bacteroidales bacterium]
MKIHREGYRILGFAALFLVVLNIVIFRVAVAGSLIPVLILALSVLKMAFLLYFFRAPSRPASQDPSAVIAPADGKVVVIEETVEKEYLRQPRLQVSVFMSPFNMHSNRYPVSGTVKEVIYHPGKYLVAWHPKSSELNERSTVVIETETGSEIVVRQIAGAIARRIVTYARPGQIVKQGDELGFIKFGSRVDVFLPLGFSTEVSLRQSVRANKTVIGRF